MNPILSEILRIVACIGGGITFGIIERAPTARAWFAACLPGTLFGAFCEPFIASILVAVYGQRFPWLQADDLRAHLAASFAFSLIGTVAMRSLIYTADALLPDDSDNLVLQWILTKLRSWLGLTAAPTDPRVIKPPSDQPQPNGA